MFSLGLDKISSETETLALTKQRNAAPKATGEPRKKLMDEDEDYEPKLTPGCPSAVLTSTVCFCAITGNLCYFPPCVSKKSMYSFSDSESDEDFSEPPESEDEEFTVKKVNKSKKKEKVTKNEKTKQPPPSKKEKPASKSSKSKSQAAGKFVHRKRFQF